MTTLSELYQQQEQLKRQVKNKEQELLSKGSYLSVFVAKYFAGMDFKVNQIDAFFRTHKLDCNDLLSYLLYAKENRKKYIYDEIQVATIISYLNSLTDTEEGIKILWSFSTRDLEKLINPELGERFSTIRLLLLF